MQTDDFTDDDFTDTDNFTDADESVVANILASSVASSLISSRGHTIDVLRPLRLNPLIGGNGHASPGGWSITTPTLLCEWVVREGELWDDVIAKVMQARRTASTGDN